ncbi:unnamed protein product, partial [Rotaria sp. Silwood2]
MITSDSFIDTYGYLYNHSFISTSPFTNLLAYDDNSGGNEQFRLIVSLHPGLKYILVTTPYHGSTTGSYTVVVSGLVEVNLVLTSNASTTQMPSITTEIIDLYVVNTTSSSAWTINSQTYTPPGSSNSISYYDTFELTVPMASSYMITSDSLIDTYGYLYNCSFIPTSPFTNLLAFDNDFGGNEQFQFTVFLQPALTYVLVTTPYNGTTTGSYTVVVSGLLRVNLVVTSNGSTTQTTPVTTETIDLYVVNTTSSSAWTINSPTYTSPGSSNSISYYEIFEITVSIAGSYMITSDSLIDTYGYLYNHSFISTSPFTNLLAYDDNSGGNE